MIEGVFSKPQGSDKESFTVYQALWLCHLSCGASVITFSDVDGLPQDILKALDESHAHVNVLRRQIGTH